VALGVVLGLVSIIAAREEKPWAPWIGGLGCGLATSLRSDSLVLVCPAIAVGFWLETPRVRRVVSLARFAFAALPFLLGLAAYNQVRFGAPWRMGYGTGYSTQQGFTGPLFATALHELFSPGRGLLVYVPLLFVALAGTLLLWKRDKVIPLVTLALVACRVLFYAKWHAWHGGVGFGPRFMVPAMPALTFGVLEIARRFATLRGWQRAAVASVALVSIAIQVPGSFTGYEHYWNRITQLPGGVDLYFFNWQYLPIVGQARMLIHRDAIVSAALQPEAGPGRLIAAAFAIAIGSALIAWGLRAISRAEDAQLPCVTPPASR
jgi:hypothetical protein